MTSIGPFQFQPFCDPVTPAKDKPAALTVGEIFQLHPGN